MSSNPSGSAGANLGEKVKGAFQAVYGMGESIRGNAMDFVDSATGTAQSGHGATVKGEQQMQTGIANMEGQGHQTQNVAGVAPTTAQTAPTSAQTAPMATQTSTAPPPTHGGKAYPPGARTEM